MKPQLSILMVNYNTRDMTLACLRSVFAETRETAFEIIMIDNASHDGSLEAIQPEFPEVTLLPMNENLGFARGTNLAATKARGEYLLLLNTDTVILDGAIDRLVAFARQTPEAGIWGGRTLFGDGRLNPTSCWRRMTPWSLFSQVVGLRSLFPQTDLFNPEGYGGWKRDAVRRVEIVTGCFFLTTLGLWTRVGGFDETFFMYAEEADLCLRAKAFGVSPIVTPDATIIHLGGGSAGSTSEKLIYQMKAKIELMRRHWRQHLLPVGKAFLILNAILRWAVAAMKFAITKQERSKERCRAWGHVLVTRRDWLKGYPPTRPGDEAPVVQATAKREYIRGVGVPLEGGAGPNAG